MGYAVYFVQAGKRPEKAFTKIGVTTDIDRRLAEMQTGNAYTLKCTGLIPCESREQAFRLERHIHHKLRHLWMSGEWFRPGWYNMEEVLGSFEPDLELPLGIQRTFAGKDTKDEIAFLKRELMKAQRKIRKLEAAE